MTNTTTTAVALAEALAASARLLAEVPEGAAADALRVLAREADVVAREADSAFWAAERAMDFDSTADDVDALTDLLDASVKIDILRGEVVRLALRAEAVANDECGAIIPQTA